jgi:hypothetical protein
MIMMVCLFAASLALRWAEVALESLMTAAVNIQPGSFDIPFALVGYFEPETEALRLPEVGLT